jgi:hypothetical protein
MTGNFPYRLCRRLSVDEMRLQSWTGAASEGDDGRCLAPSARNASPSPENQLTDSFFEVAKHD